MFDEFSKTTVKDTVLRCSFNLIKPQLEKIHQQTRNLPERMQTYGFMLLEPGNDSILALPASFCNNVIPKEYVNEFFKLTEGYQSNPLGTTNILCERDTFHMGEVWNDYAVVLGNYSYHGKLLITGGSLKKGYKALSFSQVIKMILSFELVAGYRQIEFHQLSPTSYINQSNDK